MNLHLGVHTRSLRVDFEPLGVGFGPLKSDVRNLGVDSASLGVDLALGANLGYWVSILG